MDKTLKIIKIGGNIIDDAAAVQGFLKKFAAITTPKILIHGGGKLATRLAQELQVPVTMVDGRRVTDQATLDIITMVYAGKINKDIVTQLQAHGCNAVGFSGADGNTIVSQKRPVKDIDYGFVGDVVRINTQVLQLLLENQITPVFCAITHDTHGQLLNTNADTVAAELAIALAMDFNVELYYCFEKKGVLRDVNEADSVIENVNTASYEHLMQEGIIANGMLPKLKNCFHALNNKVKKVRLGKTTMLFDRNEKHTTITL